MAPAKRPARIGHRNGSVHGPGDRAISAAHADRLRLLLLTSPKTLHHGKVGDGTRPTVLVQGRAPEIVKGHLAQFRERLAQDAQRFGVGSRKGAIDRDLHDRPRHRFEDATGQLGAGRWQIGQRGWDVNFEVGLLEQ